MSKGWELKSLFGVWNEEVACYILINPQEDKLLDLFFLQINKKKFKVFIVDEKGEHVADDIVEIRSSDSGDTEIGYNPKNLKDGLPYNLTIYPRYFTKEVW